VRSHIKNTERERGRGREREGEGVEDIPVTANT
jgi:hypothetical protein